MRVELSNWKSSVSGRLVVMIPPGRARWHHGYRHQGTGTVLCEGGSGRVISSTRQEPAPLAWQIASQ